MLHITGRVALTREDLGQGLAKSLRFGLIRFNTFTHIHKLAPIKLCTYLINCPHGRKIQDRGLVAHLHWTFCCCYCDCLTVVTLLYIPCNDHAYDFEFEES